MTQGRKIYSGPLVAIVFAVGLLGCASAGSTWTFGSPDAATAEHYSLAMKAFDEKSQPDAQAALYLLRSDVMRARTNTADLALALAVLYRVGNSVDKGDWAGARSTALSFRARYGGS